MLLNTPICNFGWEAPPFTLPDLKGDLVKFEDLLGEKGLLIAFICNHCPYVKAIIDRLVTDAKTIKKSGIKIAAIMSNDFINYPDDSPEMMKKFAQKHNFFFPYLLDEDQSVAKAYNAICTPDFFGFNSKGELQYRGRLDDARMETATNRKPELLDAMLQIAKTGKGPKEQLPSMGCSLKWK